MELLYRSYLPGVEHDREEVLCARGAAVPLLRLRAAAPADERHQRDADHAQDGRVSLAQGVQGQVDHGGAPA